MRVNEFIKKFGWCYAKHVVSNPEGFKSYLGDTSADDLKRYVDAYNMVQDLYGLDRAKEYADSKYTAPEIAEPLKKAINLVEECQ